MTDAIGISTRLPVGSVNGIPVVISPELYRALNRLSQATAASSTAFLYSGTAFPANAATPSILIQTNGDGTFNDLVIRT